MKGPRNATPLQGAARLGLTDALKCLLDAGADPNDRDEVSFVFHLRICLSPHDWFFTHSGVTLNNYASSTFELW